MDYRAFLDGCTVLYGETKTGKSFIMLDILHQLQPYVDQIIVISPMDKQNNVFKGVAPPICIHYSITANLLQQIWDRQSALTAAYKKSNRPHILRALFNKIKGNAKEREVIDRVNQKLREFISEVTAIEPDVAIRDSKINEMKRDCELFVVTIFKKSINEHAQQLREQRLTADEEYSLKYMNVNPRMIIVFDDCTAEMVKMKKDPVIKKIFFQGRWNFITGIYGCHTDKVLDPEMKKAAFVSIFTARESANAYFSRSTTNITKEDVKRASAAAAAAFTPLAPHQKLIWVRDEKKFYRYTATAHPGLRLSCEAIWAYNDKIQNDDLTVNADNQYASDFS